ncbi:protein FAR1-RELATED SEQUENCE 5-like [Pyrus ussuriensis x Pyrus communis]|uniref:Protein FAR1-RELATED SEQUENCE 5-like n=1 Tax=Pyrus ussuriensis x Pyrus communis TaxID=2448454 RepID=A0A5N5FFK1_9ROSA|nr:protein FAR1-RELATED SEQUENCE 5-like [Pyrus ussuriensis x Pyrus communis]
MDGDLNPDQGITDGDSNPDEGSFLQVASNPDEVIDIESNVENIQCNAREKTPPIVSLEESYAGDLYGKIVKNEQEAYDLYNEYAARIGFSIRKKQKRYDKNGDLSTLNFSCSKEGFQQDSDPCEEKKTKRLDERTGCQAKIRFLLEDGEWKVSTFDPEHNHELAMPEERQFLRSNRKISEAHMDCYNFVSREKRIMLEAGDAQSLINHFKRKQAEDPMFFYTVQVDQENRMTNFFWRDGRSIIDYECFGDVVVFDTTYRTNKYNMICAPFVGVNHHWSNVLLGCAFLLDEKTATFEWLFEAFLESMGNQKPITIFTDQCQAMANAIMVVFPGTCHRLCTWHISTNATRNIPTLYRIPEFKKLFNKCLDGCLYAIREKWCPMFSQDAFSVRIKSTQRSESMNNVFHRMSTKTMTLTEFVLHYEKQANGMRSKELEETFRCKQGLPSTAAKNSGFLKRAASVYTRKIYKFLEYEFVGSLAVKMREVESDGTLQTFELNEEGHIIVYVVKFNSSTFNISCSCKRFESMGLLCRHALRVMNVKEVSQIPNQYILKRWTKDAKKEWNENEHG